MECAIGLVLALSVCALFTFAGLERDRAIYPVMVIVVASYYDLFAVLGGDAATLVIETAALLGFVAVSLIGFRTNLWIVVVALIGHGVFDFFHDQVTVNAGVPAWWPMFCASFDIAAGAYLAWRLAVTGIDAQPSTVFGKRILPYVEAELAEAKARRTRWRSHARLPPSGARSCLGSGIDGSTRSRAREHAHVGSASEPAS